MLRTKIAFLKNKTLAQFNQTVALDFLPNTSLQIANTLDSVYMETPHKMTLTITNGTDTYQLPSISYGIAGNTCYIYSILNPKQTITTSYQKKIKRLLYKINDSVPENEMQVSPSAVLSLSIFLKVLHLHHITSIKAIPYLPLRYLSRDLLAKYQLPLHERNDFIQTNATNKFIDTFLRLNYHGMLNITSYPYELDDSLHINLNECLSPNNPILSQINQKITK